MAVLLGVRAGCAARTNCDALPVGLDQGHVDTVERGSTHQADRGADVWHLREIPAGRRFTLTGLHDKSAARTATLFQNIASMTTFKSDFLRTLQERGFIQQCSDPEALDALAAKGGLTAYVGYDCTAPSLHVGSLVSIMMLRWLQKTGGTADHADGRRDDTRRRSIRQGRVAPLLTVEDIEANKDSLRTVFAQFLDYGAVRTCHHGRQRRVAGAAQLHRLPARCRPALLGQPDADARTRVKLRLEREQRAVVPRIQLHDPAGLRLRRAALAATAACCRWAARTSGATSSTASTSAAAWATAQLYGLTCPLITTASGAKMGKTAAGAVWLNAEQLVALRLLAVLAEHRGRRRRSVPAALHRAAARRDARLENLHGAEINEAKKILANEATALLHGGRRRRPPRRRRERRSRRERAVTLCRSFAVPRAELEGGLSLPALFVRAGLAGSNGEVRRAVANNSISVNDVRITDANRMIAVGDINADGVVKLSHGKKKHALIVPG